MEPQFNAEQSFLGNHVLKIYGFRDTGGQSQLWRHHISNTCYYFSKYINLCVLNFMLIKIFLRQRCIVLVKEGSHTLQLQQPLTTIGTNLHFQRFHVLMKRVDWNKYLLIMIRFLRAVAKSYENWRGDILTIIFQSFYYRVT